MRSTSLANVRNLLRRSGRAGLLAAALAATPVASTIASAAVTEEEAHAIGVDAYTYFYPLITMDITRQQLTNAEAKPRAPLTVRPTDSPTSPNFRQPT